jgi:ATP-binding cassette subfamily F protein uup
MLAQRREADRTRAEPNAARPAAIAKDAAPGPALAAGKPGPKRKLSFREKHALETLPATIERLCAEIAALQARLADPKLYARDASAFTGATARLSALQAELAAAEDRWLDLELLRHELEASP